MKRLSRLFLCCTYLATLLLVGDVAAAQIAGACSNAVVVLPGTYSGNTVVPDFYRVDVPAGQVLSLQETLDSNDAVYTFWNHDCSTVLATDAQQGLNALEWANRTGGLESVVIEVEQWVVTPGSSQYIFDLQLAQAFCPQDAQGDNDSCANPALIGPGTTSNMLIGSGREEDFFVTTVPAGMRFRMEEGLDAHGVIDWILWNANCSEPASMDEGTLVWTNASSLPVNLVFQAQLNFPGGGSPCVVYEMDVTVVDDPCLGLADDVWEDNENCSNAIPLADGLYSDLFAADYDLDFFAFTVEAGSVLRLEISHEQAHGDLDGFLRYADSVACGSGNNGGLELLASASTQADQEVLTWSNSTGAEQQVVLEVRMNANSSSSCNAYDLSVLGSGAPAGQVEGTRCDPMDPNSTGLSTRLWGYWGSGVGSGLRLEATSGPPNQFGYVLVGSDFAEPGTILSNGRLCLSLANGAWLGRYNQYGGPHNSVGFFDAAGVLQNGFGTSQSGRGFDVPSTLPASGYPPITSGATLTFQLWHRENASQSNFSNALTVTF